MLHHALLFVSVRIATLAARLRRAFFTLLATVSATLPLTASAAGDLAEMGERAAEGARSGMKSALVIAQFAGVVFVIGGLIAAKTKKDNPHVKTWHIMAAILFGVCLIVVPEIIKRAQTQVGLAPVNVG